MCIGQLDGNHFFNYAALINLCLYTGGREVVNWSRYEGLSKNSVLSDVKNPSLAPVKPPIGYWIFGLRRTCIH